MRCDLSALERLLTEGFASFESMPDAEPLRVDGVSGVITGVPMTFFNGVGATNEPDVAQVIEAFRARNAPFRWWTGPFVRPANLVEQLKEHGLKHAYDAGGMVLDLDALTFVPRAIEDFEIRRVTSAEELADWAMVLTTGFHRTIEERAQWIRAYSHYGFEPNAEWTHYVGYLHGQPIASTTLLMRGELAGIYHVVTLPEARGRGIGAAITYAGLEHARRAGARCAALQSSEMGDPVYRMIGFREVCRLSLYDWRTMSS
ncbi:MAG TPA: GNAT family N-acetyltransferase [Thermoanaerobaculia bacterium]|nr:GNAT family N-acetyltransferase [Thermoanaerobaculia bacterium]